MELSSIWKSMEGLRNASYTGSHSTRSGGTPLLWVPLSLALRLPQGPENNRGAHGIAISTFKEQNPSVENAP